MSQASRIDFVVIGVQKAGTTALFEYLSEDPGLSLADVKEVHFFDDETLDWAAPDYGVYHAHFDWSRPQIRGEATPIYAYWPNTLERIDAYSPDIKLILMLRDPVARAWSHWRMETARGVEQAPFAWCIRQGRQRLFETAPWGHHREFSYVERGFYGAQLDRLYDIFPRDRVLILRAEDLSRDPDATLRQVSAFLGVQAREPVAHRTAHVGPEMGGPGSDDIAHLREVYRQDQKRLEELAGLSFF